MPRPVLNYLQLCHGQFSTVSEQLYGTPFNLLAIERSVEQLRQRDFLTYGDLRSFTDPGHWWFEQFWALPPKEKVAPYLLKITFPFRQLPDREGRVIGDLLRVFKSIELASIILRFVRPEHYGIISPPVERVLDVRRGSDAVETYLGYLKNLREIQSHYGFKRAADSDMALWVLHERVFGRNRDNGVRKAYESDPFLLALRAKNLISPIASLPLPLLAQALASTNSVLACMISCHAYELLVRQFASINGIPSSGKLAEVITKLHERGIISTAKYGQWIDFKRMRDSFFHDGCEPSTDDLQALIDEINRLGPISA